MQRSILKKNSLHPLAEVAAAKEKKKGANGNHPALQKTSLKIATKEKVKKSSMNLVKAQQAQARQRSQAGLRQGMNAPSTQEQPPPQQRQPQQKQKQLQKKVQEPVPSSRQEKEDSSARKRFAILIDADNCSARFIDSIVKFMDTRGDTFIRRAYGDWTSTQLTSWKRVLQATAIQPIQQFANTTGKNSTDAAMIIDAMDLLHMQKDLDGFCIVSSDSDFTRLVSRIRQAGLVALGFGERKTAQAFISGCTEFFYVEQLQSADKEQPGRSPDLFRLGEQVIQQLRRPSGTIFLSSPQLSPAFPLQLISSYLFFFPADFLWN